MGTKILVIFSSFFLFFLSSCEYLIFPIHSEDSIPVLDLPTGAYSTEETEISLELNGEVRKLAVISPVTNSSEPEEWFIWSMGVNNRIYYHMQWFHSLASFGVTVLVVQPKDISFLDFNHLGRIVDENLALIDKMKNRGIQGRQFTEKGAVGGYSIGASIAAFIAAESDTFSKLVLWAPSPSPYWTGVDPKVLSSVKAESLFLLAEYDNVSAPDQWPAELQGYLKPNKTVIVIPEGVHLYFMEPSAVDERNPETSQTRQSQYSFAVETSVDFILE